MARRTESYGEYDEVNRRFLGCFVPGIAYVFLDKCITFEETRFTRLDVLLDIFVAIESSRRSQQECYCSTRIYTIHVSSNAIQTFLVTLLTEKSQGSMVSNMARTSKNKNVVGHSKFRSTRWACLGV